MTGFAQTPPKSRHADGGALSVHSCFNLEDGFQEKGFASFHFSCTTQTHPCRFHGCCRHHCRSYTPAPYGDRMVGPRGSPGLAERHTPYSTHSHQVPNSHLENTRGAQEGTRTPSGSQPRPAERRGCTTDQTLS